MMVSPVSPKHWNLPTIIHDAKTQKNNKATVAWNGNNCDLSLCSLWRR
jgi:hypothetical protein